MSKPGEMVQILREAYEEQLEAYRLLRNKFLIAVPGMDLDKEKQLYDQWKLDLHLNSIISFDRALPPEPRTCETCATGCLPNERVYVNPDVETPCPGWTPRSPQSADVETARSKIELAIKFGLPIDARMALRDALAEKTTQVEMLREALINIHDYGIDRDGETTAEKLGELVDELVQIAREALAATEPTISKTETVED